MNIDYTFIGVAAVAIWSAIQEYRINKMCSSCPFLPKNQKIENKVPEFREIPLPQFEPPKTGS